MNHSNGNSNQSSKRDRITSFVAKDLISNALSLIDFPLVKSHLADQQFDVVDFFAGCGGMSYGFHEVGKSSGFYKHIGAFDIDPHANATFERNFGHASYDVNLGKAKPSEIRNILHRNKTSKNLIVIGCAPCQGFSKHRKKDPMSKKDPRNHLIKKFADIAIGLDPLLIIMENVPEILSEKYKQHYEPFKKKLEARGYQITACVVNMADYGVPQKRFRALVLASKHFKPELPPVLYDEKNYSTVRDAIGYLAPLNAGEISKKDPMHQTSKHSQNTVNILKRVPKNGGSRPKGVGPACLDKVKGFSDVYGRLFWDRTSITVTARCRTPSCGRYAHPEQNRGLTVREAALLQSFPKEFVFEGPFDDKFKQIGNAVPPVFSLYLAAHTLNMIAKNRRNSNLSRIKNTEELILVQ
ncbi:MAG: DNA cytosine methyltransferase [Bacteroidetes bacterium]|nr:DNA cytosine methyltransferase [Bacteroidota bacterium]